MFLGGLGLLSIFALGGHAPSQAVLTQQSSPQNFAQVPSYHDLGLFTPIEHLSVLSDRSFTTIGHPHFSRHSVRIKKSHFCDGTVNAYTGYIDIEARHLFFYFFESRNNPMTDDVIFWTNGGPGCSSGLGLLMELGPCKAFSGDSTTYNPYSWNSNANIFFVDQPIGVGFSYADYGEYVSTTDEAAKDIAAFLSIFFENFSQFKGRAFHMAGESYGGRYIPVFAAQVYDQNADLIKAGLTPINLQSIMIGNGITDYFTLSASYIDIQCTAASVFPPISNISTCVRMKQALPRCQRWTLESCINQFDAINCGAARAFCDTELSDPFFNTGLNPYNIKEVCSDPDDLCYPVTKNLTHFLNLPSTRALLGVDPAVHNFTSCSDDVYNAFANAQDGHRSSYMQVSALLERGVRVLVYVGTYDWICNWVGNERWTLAMQWTGQEAFVSQPLREWRVDGKIVGKTRSANGFTFATIEGAGHMVPFDKPKEALALVQRWLEDKAL